MSRPRALVSACAWIGVCVVCILCCVPLQQDTQEGYIGRQMGAQFKGERCTQRGGVAHTLYAERAAETVTIGTPTVGM